MYYVGLYYSGAWNTVVKADPKEVGKLLALVASDHGTYDDTGAVSFMYNGITQYGRWASVPNYAYSMIDNMVSCPDLESAWQEINKRDKCAAKALLLLEM